MRPDVETVAFEGDGAGKTANDLQALEQSNGRAAAHGLVRGRKSSRAPANDDDIIHGPSLSLRQAWACGACVPRSLLD